MFQKIKAEDLSGKGVIGLSDTPELSTAEMQEKFEETSRSVVIPALNALIDALAAADAAEQIGADRADLSGKTVQAQIGELLALIKERVKSGDIKAIRVNSDNQLEVSEDGENYTPIRASGGGSGMVLVAPDGTQMPERGKLQFANGTLADDSGSNRIVYTAPAGGGSGGGGLSFVIGGEQPESSPALWFDTSGSGGSVSAELLEGGADAVVQAVVDEVEHPIKNATVNTPPTSPHLYDFNIL